MTRRQCVCGHSISGHRTVATSAAGRFAAVCRQCVCRLDLRPTEGVLAADSLRRVVRVFNKTNENDLRLALESHAKRRAATETRRVFKANPRLREEFDREGLDDRIVERALGLALESLDQRKPVANMRWIANDAMDWVVRDALAVLQRALADGVIKGGEKRLGVWKKQMANPYRILPAIEKRGTSPHTLFVESMTEHGVPQTLARQIMLAWKASKDPALFSTKRRGRPRS